MTTRFTLGVFLFAFTNIFACGSSPKSPTTNGADAGPAVQVVVNDGAAPAPVVAPMPTDGGAPAVIVVDGYDAPDAPGGGYLDPRCAVTCTHLRSLACSDGVARAGEDSCYVVCERADMSGRIDFHLDCVIGAKTIADVRACKSYRCP